MTIGLGADGKPRRAAIEIEGKLVQRSRGMIFWYSWGNQSFDIRQIRRLVGLPKENARDGIFTDSVTLLGLQFGDIQTAAAALRLDPPLTFKRIIRRYLAENKAECAAHQGGPLMVGDSPAWGTLCPW